MVRGGGTLAGGNCDARGCPRGESLRGIVAAEEEAVTDVLAILGGARLGVFACRGVPCASMAVRARRLLPRLTDCDPPRPPAAAGDANFLSNSRMSPCLTRVKEL